MPPARRRNSNNLRLGTQPSRHGGRPQPKPIQLLNFLGLLVLGLIIFTFNAIYPISSLGLFLLPVIPLVRLALGPAQAAPPLRG